VEKELAERIAMALEGIEAELKRSADIAEKSFAAYEAQREKAEAAQKEFAARMGMMGGAAAAVPFRG
jgi:hypothetical protein